MNEELICSSTILNNKYEYYLVESNLNVECLGEIVRYGVKINNYNEDKKLVDTKCICDIFGSKPKMMKAIRILSKLQVTPITLEDVVIDNIYM